MRESKIAPVTISIAKMSLSTSRAENGVAVAGPLKPGVFELDASMQTASVEHWLGSHADNVHPLTLAQRALGAPGNAWTEADSALLSHFDRYCYRCHNAIGYNVFSKSSVLRKKNAIASRITSPWETNNFQYVMPQDRHLDGLVLTNFLNLLNQAK